MKKLLALATLVVVGGSLGFVLAGCGAEHAVSLGPPPRQATSISGSAATGTLPNPLSLEVWFERGGRLVRERRAHAATPRVATAALEALLAGPTRGERRIGIGSAIPPGTGLLGISIKHRVATVDLTSRYQSGGDSLSLQLRLGQVVYTLTQFPTVKSVRFELDGAPVNVFSSAGIVLNHPVGRSDYKDLAPAAAPLAGTWRRLPAAPFAVAAGLTSVWTGREMLVSGVTGVAAGGNFLNAADAAAAYDPARRGWRRLASPPKTDNACRRGAVWTGKEMLVWGCAVLAYDPHANRWRRLPKPPTGQGLVVWTGRELIGWGGGCCGDFSSEGSAYKPATNRWRRLARSPLAADQHPLGAWTGRELIILVSGLDPDGRPIKGAARAAAYNPATNSWRRLAALPERRGGASAVWDGRELLVVGGTERGGALATVGFAYDPATNRWRRLPPLESGRRGAAAAWSGSRLLLWGGETLRAGSEVAAPYGLAYDPKVNRWTALPQAPLPGRDGPTAVWTGRQLIVWGGVIGTPVGSSSPGKYPKYLADGAVFTPAPS